MLVFPRVITYFKVNFTTYIYKYTHKWIYIFVMYDIKQIKAKCCYFSKLKRYTLTKYLDKFFYDKWWKIFWVINSFLIEIL